MLPEEQELNRLESEQAILEDQVANAELTLETLKVETALFEHNYYQSVGRFYVELDQLVAQIARAEAEQEIALQKAGELYDLMVTVTEAKAMGGDPLGDLAMHIMQQISERKIELETIRQRKVAEVNM